MKVLLLEDEDSIRGFVRINLKRSGMEVVEAETGEEALQLAERETDIDIALLDVMLPTISGFDVCRELRRTYPRMGIIMLTAKAQDTDKVEGLELGADDYVAKPFSPIELVARVKALHRRLQPEQAEQDVNGLVSGPFVLKLDERKLFKNEQELDLTPTEFALIKLLLEHAGKSVSRDDILNNVWGRHYMGDLKIVDVNIRRIRKKIEDDSSCPAFIETVWGYGYLWRKDPG